MYRHELMYMQLIRKLNTIFLYFEVVYSLYFRFITNLFNLIMIPIFAMHTWFLTADDIRYILTGFQIIVC